MGRLIFFYTLPAKPSAPMEDEISPELLLGHVTFRSDYESDMEVELSPGSSWESNDDDFTIVVGCQKGKKRPALESGPLRFHLLKALIVGPCAPKAAKPQMDNIFVAERKAKGRLPSRRKRSGFR